MKQKIGFIGLGHLGTPVALNLIDRAIPCMFITVPLPNLYPLQQKVLLCATVSLPLRNNAGLFLLLFLMMQDLKNICEGENGLLNNLQKESIHISMSTILPATAAGLALLHQQHSQHYLAAPVFGRPEAAAEKKLNYIISGEENIRKQTEPLLKRCRGDECVGFRR